MLDGTPCQPWNIGEWSLDKRHFNDVHPAHPLPQPPDGANAAGVWLLNAWNEAMGAIPSWPRKQPEAADGRPAVQTLYGRRRLDWFSRHPNGFAQERRKAALVGRVLGKRFECVGGAASGGRRLVLSDSGDVSFGSAVGRWGAMNDPMLGALCPPYACLFVDVRSRDGEMNGHVEPGKLTLYHNAYKVPTRAAAEQAAWTCEEQS